MSFHNGNVQTEKHKSTPSYIFSPADLMTRKLMLIHEQLSVYRISHPSLLKVPEEDLQLHIMLCKNQPNKMKRSLSMTCTNNHVKTYIGIFTCLRKHSLVPSPRLWEVYLTEVNHCIIIIKCTRAISVLFVFHSLPLLEWRMTCSLKLQIYRTTKRIGKPLNQRLLWKNKSCHLCRPANPWSSFWQCPK